MSAPRLDQLGGLKLKELEIFYLAAKTKSIREVARRLNTTPGQISKAVKSLEKKMKTNLFMRSNTGVVLSDTGTQLVTYSEGILESAYRMESIHRKDEKKTISVAATSFLITYLVAPGMVQSMQKNPSYNLRFLDFAPDQMVSAGLRGAFEMAFHFGKCDWPATWHSEKIGSVEWVVCARAKHPLKKDVTRAELLKYPFVMPTYWTSEGLQKGNDHFEIPLAKRLQGFETSTADAAIPVVTQTDQLAVLPTVMVKPYTDRGILKVLNLKDGRRTEKDLFISAKSDALTASMYGQLKTMISGML